MNITKINVIFEAILNSFVTPADNPVVPKALATSNQICSDS
ncbi:Uncharacterised protein [Mycoplasmopsis edwardii]|uniref:Uncharacterized protein n=1 Tax=Mycoplasmopsis edwardii TaxID=53558 RepID=A0A3B0PR02_9BACT|nr:Uncharacterised protein [Mycoplasmopsis edwardii]